MEAAKITTIDPCRRGALPEVGGDGQRIGRRGTREERNCEFVSDKAMVGGINFDWSERKLRKERKKKKKRTTSKYGVHTHMSSYTLKTGVCRQHGYERAECPVIEVPQSTELS
jgi:hypothetical protein